MKINALVYSSFVAINPSGAYLPLRLQLVLMLLFILMTVLADMVLLVFNVVRVLLVAAAGNEFTLLLNRSVNDGCLKLPVRVNVALDKSKFIVTLHSRSRFCLRSRHTANAQPTA